MTIGSGWRFGIPWRGLAVFLITGTRLSWAASDGLVPTLWFSNPVPILAGGQDINFGSHAAPRFVEWNGDNLPDILVGGGDGYIWIIENHGRPGQPDFSSPVHIFSSGNPIQFGSGKTGACFADLTGDGLNDLVVAGPGWDTPGAVRLYRNRGTPQHPVFEGFEDLLHEGDSGVLPPRVEGRIDAGDFDGDGLWDLVAGRWDGDYWFVRNVGTPTDPLFNTPVPIRSGGSPISLPYNSHPRLFDVDLDGSLDLLSGYNWGDFFFWRAARRGPPGEQPVLDPLVWLLNAQGNRLSIRPLISDDSIPDLTDLDGDGVLDLLTGGANGRLFWMRGIAPVSRLERANELMEQGRLDLPDRLRRDDWYRAGLFGIHRGMRDFIAGFIHVPEQRQIFSDWYAAHIGRYPEWLQRGYKDPATYGLVPWLAAQVHTTFAESLSRPDQRGWLADTIGLQGVPRQIWCDFGTLFADNDHSNAWQQNIVHGFLSRLPRSVWDAEVISIRDYLGSNNPEDYGIASRTGINISGIASPSWCENPFPPDGPVFQNSVFTIVLAHEITHTIDRWYVQENPRLNARRLELLSRAGFVDLQYLRSQVGASFFQQNPQEFLASIGNQYFGNTSLTLTFARDRFDRGFREPLNQFLFFADFMSLGQEFVPFYTISSNSDMVDFKPIPAGRDDQGRLESLRIGRNQISFDLDQDGYVLAHDSTPWNQKPIGDCPAETQVRECTGPEGASWEYDVSGSYDPEGDPLTFLWEPQGEPCVFSDPSAPITQITCPVCSLYGAWVRIDDGFDDPTTCSTIVTVQDTLPPVGEITQPRPGECFGPGTVTVVDNFRDQCYTTIQKDYLPGPGPAYQGHGDHTVTLTVIDPKENSAMASVSFTIDEMPPAARLLAPRDGTVLQPTGQPIALLIASADDDGANGGVVHEVITLAGCVIFDGATDGDGDGLLSDETLPLDTATICRVASLCGFTQLLDPELRVVSQDCGGNTGSDGVRLRGNLSLVPGLCTQHGPFPGAKVVP